MTNVDWPIIHKSPWTMKIALLVIVIFVGFIQGRRYVGDSVCICERSTGNKRKDVEDLVKNVVEQAQNSTWTRDRGFGHPSPARRREVGHGSEMDRKGHGEKGHGKGHGEKEHGEEHGEKEHGEKDNREGHIKETKFKAHDPIHKPVSMAKVTQKTKKSLEPLESLESLESSSSSSSSSSDAEKIPDKMVPPDRHHQQTVAWFPLSISSDFCQELLTDIIKDDIFMLITDLEGIQLRPIEEWCLPELIMTAKLNGRMLALEKITTIAIPRIKTIENYQHLFDEAMPAEILFKLITRKVTPEGGAERSNELLRMANRLTGREAVEFIHRWMKLDKAGLMQSHLRLREEGRHIYQTLLDINHIPATLSNLSNSAISGIIKVTRLMATTSMTPLRRAIVKAIVRLDDALLQGYYNILDLKFQTDNELVRNYLKRNAVTLLNDTKLPLESFLAISRYYPIPTAIRDNPKLSSEHRKAIEIIDKLANAGVVNEVCRHPQMMNIDDILTDEEYSRMTGSAAMAIVGHAIYMRFGIHPDIQRNPTFITTLHDDTKYIIESYCSGVISS